ncbi:MAG: OB-fold nucleic acid binding domain-containing protein [Candidatus Aenigmatarchaeota archaeon]
MNDITIIKIALVMTVVGVALLMLLVYFNNPVQTAIIDITPSDVGRLVYINGKLTTISYSEGGTIFVKVSDMTGGITGVIFKSSDINTSSFSTSDEVTMTGEVAVYRGELEIIVNRLEKR